MFNQVTKQINFINEKGINDLNVKQKIYHSILRSAIRKNCNSFISSFMNARNSLYAFFIGEKSILEMSEFIFLNALTEGRSDMINFIWDSEELGNSREKDNMLIKILGSSDFRIDGSYESFYTLRWIFNHINTDKSPRQGVKAFRIAWTVRSLFSYALLHERIDILNFLHDSWFLVFEDKTRMLDLLVQHQFHHGSSDEMIKWQLNTFNTYSENTLDALRLRLAVLCTLQKSLSELNTRLDLNLNEDILSLLKLTDNNSRDINKLIIDRIVVSDDVEMLNSLWNDAKKKTSRVRY
ncbi:hypothetical protein [Wolbachia endosymbiont of Chironomus riparius]|uniref:hypothetical protein n=1 Tax=Wolbachia endosymbiont of Chironomus riparius TaxID=2883238 RepID=UPI0020A12A1A|nr:hypothetical protein [Wolbachia endosymbiont of Chironomus riparius]